MTCLYKYPQPLGTARLDFKPPGLDQGNDSVSLRKKRPMKAISQKSDTHARGFSRE